eukprot:COSAG01_NODE_2375_length_7802_cov_60.079579_5_plen_45_part_00
MQNSLLGRGHKMPAHNAKRSARPDTSNDVVLSHNIARCFAAQLS